MPATAITTEKNGVLTVTFSNPDKLNAMDDNVLAQIGQAVEAMEARRDLRVLLIRSEGSHYFSSGMDVNRRGDDLIPAFNGSSMEARRWYRNGLQAMLEPLEILEKPVVVAHHGPCLGGALEMSSSCDFRLASENAAYGLPEVFLGVLPGSGGTSRITRLVGPHWARWLVLAGERMDAETARQAGLVHKVYPSETFEAETEAFCARLADLPPEVVAMSKLSIELCKDLEKAQGRTIERLANSVLFLGDERLEAMEKFKNRKRKKES